MPTTRRQEAIKAGKIKEETHKPSASRKRSTSPSKAGQKRKRDPNAEENKGSKSHKTVTFQEQPHSKRSRVTRDDIEHKPTAQARPRASGRRASSVPHTKDDSDSRNNVYQTGTIERGHIYFFYRPKVQVEGPQSIDEVKNLHMLLIPTPPEFASGFDQGEGKKSKADPARTEEAEMKVLAPGADAVPAHFTRSTPKQRHRLVTIGKKKLPDPHGKGRKETFWGVVTSIGEDLRDVVKGLGPKEYETKTRGTRHEGAARLVARGGYALVNTEARVPSQRETHLGYNVSHPAPEDMSEVQAAFGIYSASSFVVQVKNPKAPNVAPGMSHTKEAEYPEWIMRDVFGSGNKGGRGREPYGLRFASVETPELLDYEGAQLLLIAARDGEQGLETSLGEGRGQALAAAEHQEATRRVEDVLKEIGLNPEIFPKDPLKGRWA